VSPFRLPSDEGSSERGKGWRYFVLQTSVDISPSECQMLDTQSGGLLKALFRQLWIEG